MSRYSFRVPASTSNLGAGFDALGLALNRYLKVTIEDFREFIVEARGISTDSIPRGPANLILRVAQRVAATKGRELPPFRLRIDNEIPIGRGLGSSAAAIIAGITCYELMTQDRLSDDDIFRQAFTFESHPDNLAASFYGGLIAAMTAATSEVLVARLEVDPGAASMVVVPNFKLSTRNARAALPDTYSRADAIYNVQRSALTIAALTTGKWSLLREAMRDRMHQPFRAALIPGLDGILALDTPGLLGIALSGAGPSVFAFTEPDRTEAVGTAIAAVFENSGVHATAYRTEIDTKGRIIEGSA